jgi:hypothetical protein
MLAEKEVLSDRVRELERQIADLSQQLEEAKRGVPQPAGHHAEQDFPAFSAWADDGCSKRGGDDEELSFLLQRGVDAIEYLAPEEVERLLKSVNVAYLSPEGKGPEICQGYICGIRRGSSWLVYAALFGVESHRTRVYEPEEQPSDEQSYLRALRGAIAFAEQVGLLMEPEKSGVLNEQHREMVLRCPVLRGRGKG